MNTLKDHEALIAAWLDDGPRALPADTRQAITVGIRAVQRNRPAEWPFGLPRLRRPQVEPRRLATALGTAAVLVVAAAVALNFFANQGIGVVPSASPSVVPSPTVVPSATVAPSPTVAPLPTVGATTAPGATATPFPSSSEDVAIEPGTYRIPSSRWSLRDFTVTFPEGWTVQYGHVYHRQSHTEVEISFYAVGVTEIFADACVGSGGEVIQVGGNSIEDLAAALLQQAGPLASSPVETILGGHRALRVDVSIPEGVDLSSCNVANVGLQIWYSAPADKNLVVRRDEIMSVYIVDLDGRRQVFVAGREATSDDDAQKLQEVLDSIRIALTMRPMPGTFGPRNPPGLYGWVGSPGEVTGMHYVVDSESREATVMGFAVGPNCLVTTGNPDPESVQIGDLDGVQIEPYEPALAFGGPDGDEITRAYALDVGDATLCVFLTWHQTTTAEEIGRAEATVQSLRAEAFEDGSVRILFELFDNWDTG